MENVIEDGIDHGGNVVHHPAQGEEDEVEDHAELAHSDLDALLGHIQADDVQSAAAAAAGQGNARPYAGDYAPQQAAGQDVLHDRG